MPAKVEYKASVEKDLRRLGASAATRVQRKIEATLTSEGHQGFALTGEFAGMYKLRIGDYRVIYIPTHEGYRVLRIGHRRDVYRKGAP